MVDVRILTADDAAGFQAIRLRSLKEHPEAFASSYEESVDTPIATMAEILGKSLPDSPSFGAFVDGELVGIVNIARNSRVKTRHRMNVGAMYVAPEARGKRIGEALLNAAIDYAKNLGDVRDVVLAVTVGNDAARSLYTRMGFVSWGIDPRYIRLGDSFYDLDWMVLALV